MLRHINSEPQENRISGAGMYLCHMNFLAHAYLSFEIPEILVGNLISDFVKGKKKFDYSLPIQHGISLHRSIDHYTDTHPVTSEAKSLFKADYGLYAGAFMDIVYDHFLANDRNEFRDEQALAAFSKKTYEQLKPFIDVFPQKFQIVFMHMQKHDWLYHYRLKEGIRNSFAGLVHRAAYMHDHRAAYRIFEAHYSLLRDYYREFFPGLRDFARLELTRLNEGT
ncbi:MAG TPA: ACP phosphodiesterase [Puia sp.]|nr:ACP phosphodiesterase [Puia sp.]